jgi:hypothetical protein
MSQRSPLPPRYPSTGEWPAVMPADMTAAYLDYRDTSELARAVSQGEAPPPIGHREVGSARGQPIWSKAAIDKFFECRFGWSTKIDGASLE